MLQIYSKVLNGKKKGSATLVTIVVMFFILAFVLIALNEFPVLQVHNKLKEVGRGAMLKMEAVGGITPEIRDIIDDNISDSNLDPTLLSVSSNYVVIPGSPVPTNTYGNKLTLELTYEYHYNSYTITGFQISRGEKVKTISTKLSTSNKAN